jgi:hypothetical protein
MDAPGHDDNGPIAYTTPARVQAWFLRRSRQRWKKKYMQLKADAKRLQNRVYDVAKSRETWRDESKQLLQRLRALEAENAALRAQAEDSKKNGRGAATRRVG